MRRPLGTDSSCARCFTPASNSDEVMPRSLSEMEFLERRINNLRGMHGL